MVSRFWCKVAGTFEQHSMDNLEKELAPVTIECKGRTRPLGCAGCSTVPFAFTRPIRTRASCEGTEIESENSFFGKHVFPVQ